MAKFTLKSYLLDQGVAPATIKLLAEFRATYGADKDDPRVRAPKSLFIDAYRDESGKTITKGVLRKSLSTLLAGDSLLLTGPKGSGKNTLADTLAFVLRRPLYEVPMHVHADAESLLGKDTFKPVPVEREVIAGIGKDGTPIKTVVVERQGEVMFNMAQFAEALQVGGVVVLDELNMGRPEAEAVLHPVLDDRRRIDIPGYGLLQVHPAARVIATMNHGYAGTQELNEALADRFVNVEVPPMRPEELTSFLVSRFSGVQEALALQLSNLFHDIMKASERDLQPRAITFRGLLQALRLIRAGLTPHEAVSTCVVGRTFDSFERGVLQRLVDTRVSASWTAAWAFSGPVAEED